MSLNSTDQSYGSVARALHWSIAILIVLQIASGFSAGVLLPKAVAFGFHKPTGLVVLVLTVARLAWMLVDSARPGDAGRRTTWRPGSPTV